MDYFENDGMSSSNDVAPVAAPQVDTGTAGNNPSAYVAPGYSPADIAEALGYTGMSSDLANTTAGALSYGMGSDTSDSTTAMNNPSAYTAPSKDDASWTKQLSDIINGAGANIEKNKELYKTVLGGVGSAFAAQRARETAAALAQSRLNELSKADEIRQAEQKRNAAAIVGIPQGIIGKQLALRRTNGNQVFNANGTPNKG